MSTATSHPTVYAIELWPLDHVIPYAQNPRTHSDAQVAQIAASIREFGFNNPILVDSSAGMIAGHGRLLAAQKLGLEQVPVIVLDHLTNAQKRAYILADNQLALNAGWDEDLLRLELTALRDEDFDISLVGFEDEELARLLASQETEGFTDEDAVPPLAQAPISKIGDLWVLDVHRVLCGDCTVAEDVQNLLGTVKPHLMVTDPPYGVEYDPTWRNAAGVNKSTQKSGKVRK